jgi:signal transduction histidine kinase
MIRSVAHILSDILPICLTIIEEAKKLNISQSELLKSKQWSYLSENTPIISLQKGADMIDNFINASLTELTVAQKADQEGLVREDLTLCSSRRIIENTMDVYPFETEIKIHQDISYEFFFMGNSVLMMKVLFNLLKNAVEQIELQKKGEITISTESSDDFNFIKIKDTAGGASPEVSEQLFTGYFTTKKQGTGIGLAFCKRVVESLGGKIFANSIYGSSMEFVISFPKMKQDV